MSSTFEDRVDGISTSVAVKAPCRLKTTAAVTLSGVQTIDSVVGAVGDRILVGDQADQLTNGIYSMELTSWTREDDFNGNRDVVNGTLIRVNEGTLYADTYWEVSTADPVTFGTSNITFSQSNNALAGVSAFMETVLDDTTAAIARATLEVYSPLVPDMYGTVDNTGVADSTDAFVLWAAVAGQKYIQDGTYKITKQLDFTASQTIRFGNVTLDFSSATTAGDFSDNACLFLDGGALTALPDIDASLAEGDTILQFGSTPSLSEGDVAMIYDPTDSSYHGATTYYRAGEMCRVMSLTGDDAAIAGGVYDAYTAATVDMYKLGGISINLLGGKLEVICPNSIQAVRGIEAKRLVDSHFSGLCVSNSGNAGFIFAQCYNVTGTAFTMRQHENAALGTDYGCVIANTQKLMLNGTFYGRRHGVTMGGEDEAGCVPNREVVVKGTFSNDPASGQGVGSANAHGNSEFYSFEGVFHGGINPGGDHSTWKGQIFVPDLKLGTAVYFSDMLGWHHDLSNLQIKAHGNPTSGTRGVIDLGGNSATQATVDTTRGGTLNLRGIQISAVDATSVVRIVNRGSVPAEKIVIDMTGLSATLLPAGITTAVIIDAVSGDDFDILRCGDVYFSVNAAWSVAGTTSITGWTLSGQVDVDTTTGIATIAGAVVYSKKAPKIATVTVGTSGAAIGTIFGVCGINSNATTGFDAVLSTVDAANFPAAVTRTLYWHAAVDD